MKTKIISVILILVLAGTSQVFAGKPAAESMVSKFRENVYYPEKAARAGIEGNVDVVFIIENNEIVVKSITSSEPELKKVVTEQLSQINCSDIKCGYNEHFKISFKFKLV